MTSVVEVIPTTLGHVRDLRRSLRKADEAEAVRMGLDPQRAAVYAYKQASWRRTGLIDGEPAAMWGLRGNLLGLVAQPYLITSERINLISPLKFAKIYIKEVQQMNKMFPILENYVDASYTGACRLLEIAGFTLEPVIIRDHEFYRFTKVAA